MIDDEAGTAIDTLPAQQQLAMSRRALTRHFEEKRQSRRTGFIKRVVSPRALAPVAQSMVHRWWDRHPANVAGQLFRPLLERYAHRHPARMIGTAAAAGALIALIRPWRFLPIGALFSAGLKTSAVAGVITALLKPQSNDSEKEYP